MSVQSPRSTLPVLSIAALTAGLILLAIIQAGDPRTASAQGLQGDVNCSSAVDSVDGLFVLRFTAELEPFAKCIDTAADVNCDDAIESLDALSILRHVAGLTPLPVPTGCTAIGEEIPATPTPEPTPVPTPILDLEVKLIETDLGIDEPNMDDIAMIPGTPDEAVVATQYGALWRVSLSGAFEPVEFGDITDRMTRVSDEGLLGMTFAPGDASTMYLNYTTGGPGQYSSPEHSCQPAAPTPHLDPKRNRISRFAVVNDELDPRQRRDHHGNRTTSLLAQRQRSRIRSRRLSLHRQR